MTHSVKFVIGRDPELDPGLLAKVDLTDLDEYMANITITIHSDLTTDNLDLDKEIKLEHFEGLPPEVNWLKDTVKVCIKESLLKGVV